MEQQLHPGQPPLELPDPGDGPDGVQNLGSDALDVLPLRDRKDQALGLAQGGFDAAQGRWAPRSDGRGDPRKEYDFPERQYRQSQTFGHCCLLLLPNPHYGGKWQVPHTNGAQGAATVP